MSQSNGPSEAQGAGAPAPQLRGELGILQATSINMSNMIGIGPFITVPLIIATMGGPQSLLSWLVGAVLAICDGLVVSELGAALPGSGGAYVFLRDALGKTRWGRLMAWMFVWQFLFSGPLEIASAGIGMVNYCSFLWHMEPITMKWAAALICAIVVFALYRHIKDVARLMLGMWIVALVTTGWVILAGLTHMNTHLLFDFPAGAFKLDWAFLLGLGNGTVLVIYNYLGYNQVCFLGGEVKRPERTIPYAVILSVLAVTLIDVLVSASFTGVVPWREMIQPGTRANQAVAAVFMSRIYGDWAAVAITILILGTSFACVFALMLGYSRIPFAAAQDGVFFRWFGVLHGKGGFPHRSLLLVGALCVVACFFALEDIIKALLLARILVMFVGQIVALFVLRRYRPEVPLPFRMWFYPIPAALALIGWLYVFMSPLGEPGGWKYGAYTAATIAGGLLAFLVAAWRKRSWPFEEPAPVR
jgi:amino acid transporter